MTEALKFEYPASVVIRTTSERPTAADIEQTLALLSGISMAYGVELEINLRAHEPDHVERWTRG